MQGSITDQANATRRRRQIPANLAATFGSQIQRHHMTMFTNEIILKNVE